MPEQKEQVKTSPTTPAACSEGEAKQGYGACSASGCYCQSYGGNGDTCSNCGHNYATHW